MSPFLPAVETINKIIDQRNFNANDKSKNIIKMKSINIKD